jgi:hypothetical protein
MNDDDRVFARFDHFVEVADRAALDGGRERPVVPDGLFAFEQETTDEIGRR